MPSASTPEVHLLRHGESTFNALSRDRIDPMVFDSRLTDLGRRQAAAAADRVFALAPDLLVTSPLSRALETAELVSRGRLPVHVTAAHRERLFNSCDVGRPAPVLAAEYPHWDFAHLPKFWWSPHRTPACPPRGTSMVESETALLDRVQAFRRWLRSRPERRIVVVGHRTFFHRLTGQYLDNGDVVALTFPDA